MTSDALRERLATLLPDAEPVPRETVRGEAVIVVPRDRVADALRTLRDHADTRFDQLSDLTVVDYLGRTPRFEVVYQLYSVALAHRVRVKVSVGEDDPVVPTATALWKSADWAEREAWDMFGIRFAGHPDLRRILMYPEFEGHPLRKDYPLQQRQPLVPERDPIARPWYPRNGGR
ncbi:MAG TPA: NADH-quinone oxidoreductase subunit C [Candidatus Binatia bacterium]|nr:NADH-quinone oxidoreductase subunit C [Candidatus Binatia bacterium]